MPTPGDLIFDAILKLVFDELVRLVPFLGWPGISTIVYLVLSKIGGLIYDQLSRFIDFELVDFQVDEQNTKYKEALAELKKAQEAGDAAAMEKAKSDFSARLHDLIRLH